MLPPLYYRGGMQHEMGLEKNAWFSGVLKPSWRLLSFTLRTVRIKKDFKAWSALKFQKITEMALVIKTGRPQKATAPAPWVGVWAVLQGAEPWGRTYVYTGGRIHRSWWWTQCERRGREKPCQRSLPGFRLAGWVQESAFLESRTRFGGKAGFSLRYFLDTDETSKTIGVCGLAV